MGHGKTEDLRLPYSYTNYDELETKMKKLVSELSINKSMLIRYGMIKLLEEFKTLSTNDKISKVLNNEANLIRDRFGIAVEPMVDRHS